MKGKNPGWLIAALLTSAGGLFLFSQTAYFLTYGVKTQGQVMGVHTFYPHRHGGGSSLVEITYATADGQRTNGQVPLGSNFILSPQEGDQVTVYYLSGNPDRFKLGNFYPFWFIPGFLTFFGLGWVWWLLKGRKNS
jgi:hypothetical protein